MASQFHQTALALHERPRQHRVKWWRHESDIYKMLGLDSVDQLDDFVLQCGRGYSGVGSAKIMNREPFGASIDLQTPEQQEILQWQWVQGTHCQLKGYPDMKTRRINEWYAWATGAGGEQFHKHDMPFIAAAFRHCWDADIPATTNLSCEHLRQVKEEIVELLEASGLIPAKNELSVIQRVSARTRRVDVMNTDSTAAIDRRVQQRVDESSDESDSSEEESEDEVDESISIDYGHIRKQLFDDSLDGMDPKERVYFDQLEPNSEDVLHWFRQIGLARAVVREELIVLVQEKQSDRDPDSKTPLQDFETKYPVLYDLLFSFVGHSASNSRIVELLHAFVRQIYDPNMPMECLDNRLNHMMGDEYVQRDERRDVSKKNRDPSLPYSKPKHLDRKETQQMQGEQMLDGSKKYQASAIAALPLEFQEQIKIKNLNKQGHMTMEKQFKDALQSAWEERTSNKLSRSARQLDLVELGQEAAQALSEHDKQWSKRGNVQLAIITEKMATKTHFNAVPVANDAFYNEILHVLPYIGESFDPPPPFTTTMKSWMPSRN
eukprot:scaffold37956_cov48-Cyclotella_meneghiniana.AAC.2